MSNLDTIKAITTNLKAIISTTLAWSREDLSADPHAEETLQAKLIYREERPKHNFGEAPGYIEAFFVVEILTNKTTPDDIRDSLQAGVHGLIDAVTINALNVGDLAASKLVSWVEHAGSDAEQEVPLSTIRHPITIRYRKT